MTEENKREIVVPDLEEVLKELDRYRFTDDIDTIIYSYYLEFARRQSSPMLADFINKKFNTDFSADQVARRARTLKVT